mgnify:CR=1 FL=1
MTGQSLFYMGETDLKHKILAIAEEEGARVVQHPLQVCPVRADDVEIEVGVVAVGSEHDPFAIRRLFFHKIRR